MKEITFLKQNYQKWQQFEDLLNSNQGHDPDALADLFIRITDDLSWAHTFYPGSNTEKYLNDLAAKIHQEIYKNKKEKRSRIITFWTDEFPRLMAKHRMNLGIIFLIFIVSVWIGVISAQHDQSFVRIILGDHYVDKTLESMNSGDPMNVYKGDYHFVSFFELALHNSQVALFCIVLGFFGWIGVAWMQFYNGVMLGSFLYFLASHGFFHEAMLTVWMHGVIEISSILVAGAAGLALGNSLYFPGAWPRMVSFRRGAREALKIGVGLIPFFFIAAFFEGFITRYTGLSDYLRLTMIGLSLTLVIGYFVVLPYTLEYKKQTTRKPMNKFWLVVMLIFALPAIPFSIRTLRREKLLGEDADYSMWDKKAYMNPKTGFLYLLGVILTTLPTIALVGQNITGDKWDYTAIFFFGLCYVLAGLSFASSISWLFKEEEEDLIISRKNSAKENIYERDATSIKI